jgi:Domain of unknown function (DUF4286)
MSGTGFLYVVRIAFVDHQAMEGFLRWLRDRHIADVCAAGASDAELVVLDPVEGGRHTIEARYRFASRDAFGRYERDHAPRLRADGLAELARLEVGPDGVTFTRTTGEIVARG